MKFKFYFTLFFFFQFLFIANGYSNTEKIIAIEDSIFQGKFEIAQTMISEIDTSEYTHNLFRITNKEASYDDFHRYIVRMETRAGLDFLKLSTFIKNEITPPVSDTIE